MLQIIDAPQSFKEHNAHQCPNKQYENDPPNPSPSVRIGVVFTAKGVGCARAQTCHISLSLAVK
jgi:hypothetical protein